MRHVIQWASVLGLSLTLGACGDDGAEASGPSGGEPAPFAVSMYNADPEAEFVNSVLIEGEREAILVDSQMLKPDGDKVVDMVRSSGKILRYVFITHAHRDHFLALSQIHAAFPDTEIVATPEVAADIAAAYPGVIEKLKQTPRAADVPDEIVEVAPLEGDSLSLEGQTIEVITLPEPGESKHAAALALKSPNALIAGDLIYNQVHLILAACAPEGWLDNLAAVKQRNFDTIYPGHGPAAGMEAFDAAAAYLGDVVPILEAAASPEDALAQIKQLYPSYVNDYLLGFSVNGYFQNCKTVQ